MQQFLRYLLLLCILISSLHCRVTRLPDFDADLYRQLVSTIAKTDQLYINMRLADSSQRKFSLHSKKYANVEKSIRIIALQYESRPFNTRFLPIINNITLLFERYRDEHRSRNKLPTDAELLIYQTYLRDAWKPLLIAEQSLKR
ncbi:MAG: hypothetical protein IM571_10935 [Chitinophagaceae bacterium]|nr:hypothetical protein [Chitinophagaceae bacterium]MCA6471726.1 hypothetical protein [Chitinophagaceae bacterium]MCA6478453.1 hypothetical protein [Chitinophagaceae bacterium]MCA6481244.1 hypothetical protein [Chitinophagaceae bacterium]